MEGSGFYFASLFLKKKLVSGKELQDFLMWGVVQKLTELKLAFILALRIYFTTRVTI